MILLRALVLIVTVPIVPLLAQAADGVSFEAVSIRVRTFTAGEGSTRSKIEYTPGNLSMSNVSLEDCIEWAYDLRSFQVEGSTAVDSERYEIRAKAAAAVPVDQLRLMLQDLLKNRFQMASHRAEKPMQVYELQIAKGGPKLPAPKTDSEISAVHARESLPRVAGGDFIFEDASMTDFAEKLSMLRTIEFPVIDKTGIPGVYDIRLQSAASALLDKEGVSLFTLIPEQLGLRLVKGKDPIPVLVIDGAQRPSEN